MTEQSELMATRKEVRRFGFSFGGILAAIAVLMFYKGSGFWLWSAVSAFFVVAGMSGYRVLRPVYIGWMKLASLLAWINTRVLLSVFFFVILTPIGLLMKLFNDDLMDQKIVPEVKSYWKKRKSIADPKMMERQF